jgi:hypothetical protein
MIGRSKYVSYACEHDLTYCDCLLTNTRKEYGTDRSQVPRRVPNYFYGMKTSSGNLRNHLRNCHGKTYDEAVIANGWPYALSTDQSQPPPRSGREGIPSYSLTVFIDHLVRFIIADDQVSRKCSCALFTLTHL